MSMAPDLARIAFVTRRFGELQGLQSVSLGAGLILGVLSWSLLPEEFRNPFQHIVFPAAIGMLGLIVWIAWYYRRSFGRVPPMPSRPGAGPQDSREILHVSPMYLGLTADMAKGFVYPGGPSPAAAVLAGYSLWILVRDGRHRWHYGMVATWATPFALGIVVRLDPAVAGPYVLMLVEGLLDYRLTRTAGPGFSKERHADAI
ncbi:MAG TPA: hypothetical protein VJ813_14040 [Vicinamibacterales bacterium]|nr:hypothetical protein [Vicinamibacterales bacterium]